MKSNGDFWEGQNGNKWSKSLYTKEAAIKQEKTLNNCSYCSDCSDCSDCSYCSRCSYCSGCDGCSGCDSFQKNPNRYTGQKIGSRNAQTTAYWTKDKNQVVCGCWKGTIEEFKIRVQTIYGDSEYGKQYQQYIKIVEMVMEMEVV